jgi:hypothetical protein
LKILLIDCKATEISIGFELLGNNNE